MSNSKIKAGGRWTVSSWWRRGVNIAGQPVAMLGAKIIDKDRGLTYWATARPAPGGAELTYVAVQASTEQFDPDGDMSPAQPITRATMQSIPVAAIARETVQTVREMESDPDMPLAFRSGVTPSGRHAPKPTDWQAFAAEVARHTQKDIAARYGVSTATITRWVAEGRRVRPDLFPPARRGRPAKTRDAGDASDRAARRRLIEHVAEYTETNQQ